MKNKNMLDILQNFDDAEKGNSSVTATSEDKADMKNILSNYDSILNESASMPAVENDLEEDLLGEPKITKEIFRDKFSFKDVLKSMEEDLEEEKSRLEKEFHTHIQKEKMKKNNSGSYDLNESLPEYYVEGLHNLISELLDVDSNLESELKSNAGQTLVDLSQKIINLVKEIQRTS